MGDRAENLRDQVDGLCSRDVIKTSIQSEHAEKRRYLRNTCIIFLSNKILIVTFLA